MAGIVPTLRRHQRGKHEIKGCRQFDPAPVGRLARRATA
jgi:hypothetical protein